MLHPLCLLLAHWTPQTDAICQASLLLARTLVQYYPVKPCLMVPHPQLPPGDMQTIQEETFSLLFYGESADPVENERLRFDILTTQQPWLAIHAFHSRQTGFTATFAARYLHIPVFLSLFAEDYLHPYWGASERQEAISWMLQHADVVTVSEQLGREECQQKMTSTKLPRFFEWAIGTIPEDLFNSYSPLFSG